MYRLTVFSIIFCLNVFAVQTFNLTPKPTLIIRKPATNDIKHKSAEKSSSLFGYTIVLRGKSILIGAPQAVLQQTDGIRTESGTIYKYNLKTDQIEPFNFAKLRISSSFGNLVPNATHQWLGGAMEGGSGDKDPLVICAPLLTAIYSGRYSNWRKDLAMHGVCYYLKNGLAKESNDSIAWTLSPFTDKDQEWRQYDDGNFVFGLIFGEFGFSVHITPNNEEILAGAPGTYGWSGTVVHLNKKGQSIFEVGHSNFFEYTGYAVDSGYFSGNRRQLFYVTTQPGFGANKKFGKAFIYNKVRNDTFVELTLEGQQYGEFYGYALLVEDITGDGLDDILISAPYYSTKNIYNAGRVYVYINRVNLDHINFKPSILNSPFPNSGYFGAAITKLGDINKDGYNDIAISAPLAGADNEGAVVIYFGGPNDLDTQPRQILKAIPQIGSNSMFGLGLSKSVDLYGNDQNCLAVGAPNAEIVFLYRSYPVVKINASIKALNAYIPLNTKEVRIDICVNILTNFTRVKNQEVLLDLKADERIDTAECNRNKTFLAKLHATCFNCLAKITSAEASVFVPMLMELSYRLKNDANTASETDFCENCAAVDPTLPNVIKTTIQYLHDCEGSVCVADLQLQNVDIPPKITLGSIKILPLKYKIKNVGENALYTKLIIRSAPSMPIAQTPAECIMELNSDWIICTLAQRQAFMGNTTLEVEVSLDLNEVVGIDKLTIEAHVSSAGDEKTPADNSVVSTIELITAAEIWITETTSNEITEILNEEKRYRVKRYFELTNNGPSSLGGLNILSAALPIGYVDDKGIAQNYVSNIIAQVYIKDFIYPPMSFNTTQSLSHEELNTTELLNVYHIPENRTTFLSCQPNGETNVKRLCAFGNFPLTSTLRSAQKLALKLQYEIQWHNVENLMLRDREYLAHVAMVDLQPGAKLNGLLSTKKRLKAALFVKINKKSTLWIYVVAAIGGLLLLVGIVLLLKKFGFFKRLTREAMEENYKDKDEKALMKDQLDKVADDIDMELDENVECN